MDKISIKDLTFKYKNSILLKNINLKIKENTTNLILGPLNSGKSTLYNLILNYYDGIKINGHINYVLTNPDLQIMSKTVEGQLKFFLETEGYKDKEVEKRVKKVIEKYKLTKIKNKDPFELSYGVRSFIVLLSVLILDLDILIIDGTLANLDYNYKKQILDMLKDLNTKTTIIYFSNDKEEIINFNNIILLDKTVIFNCKQKEVINHEKDLIKHNLCLPFSLELSSKLKYYDVLKKEELDLDKLVKNL